MTNRSFYDTLGLQPNATQDQIKEACRAMARANHPDKNPYGAQLMQEINEAHETLSDPTKRREYDRTYRSKRANPVTPPRSSGHAGARGSKNGAHGGFGGGSNGARGGDYARAWEKKKRRQEEDVKRKKEEKRQREAAEAKRRVEEEARRKQQIECIICMHCHGVVKKCSWTSSCCGRLCCEDCLGVVSGMGRAGNNFGFETFTCPNDQCQITVPIVLCTNLGARIPQGWTKSSKFTQNLIDELAPTHSCGQNVLPENLAEHETVCPNLNTPCFKCIEQTKVGLFGKESVCHGCNGTKFLKGKNWVKCFRCGGSGFACPACSGKGALEGIWSKCFKCGGAGSIKSQGNIFGRADGNLVGCSVCTVTDKTGTWNRGALWGYWTRCIQCMGKGGPTCVCGGKGAVGGSWSLCFKCNGEGYVTTVKGDKFGRNICDSCNGSKVIQERNCIACHLCSGCGCVVCVWKGRESCLCGDSCQGHTPINE